MKTGRICMAFTVALFLASCGSSSSSDSGGTTPAGTTVTVSGTLGTGTVANIGAKTAEAASGYTVVAIENSRCKTYSATTNADGTFSMDVPSDTQLLLGLIKDGAYQGPVVLGGTGDEVNTVIKPTANVNLGSFTTDLAEGYTQADVEPEATDTSVVAMAQNGKPLCAGADNIGKNINAGVVNTENSDKDKDGCPNLFDAAEDNVCRTGTATMASCSTVVSDHIERAYMSSNIWAIHGEDLPAGSQPADVAPELIAMWLNIVPKAGEESNIASVQCTDVPATIKDVAKVRYSSSIGDPVDYPTSSSTPLTSMPLWRDSGYNLYKTTTLPQEEWIISLQPNAVMAVGDTFTIKVTYTDSTYEYFYIEMPYIMTDWSKITTYTSAATALTDAVGSRTTPATFTAATLPIVFSKPLDEDGNVLDCLTYSVIFGPSTLDPSSGRYQVADPSLWTVIRSSDITDNGDGTLSATITPTTAGTTYYVTPVAETADGQRNGEETWFTRTD